MLLILWAVAGFLVLPRLLRPVVERKLTERLHRPVTLRSLSINPFALSATLEGLSVKDRDGGHFFSFESLYVNLEMSSIFRGGPVLSAIRLSKPAVTLIRFPDGTYNLQDLLPKPEPGPAKEEKDEKPLRFSLNNIEVEGGSVDFDDRPKQTKHAVRGLRIGIPFLSNIPSKVEITTQPVFEAKVNGAPLSLHGETKPFSETRETTLDLVFDDVDLPFYLAYVPAETPSKLTSGRLDAKLTITFAQPLKGSPALLVSGSSVLRKVAVSYGGRPILAWDRFEAVIDSVDVFGRKALIRSMKAAAPEVWVRRESMGEHNIAKALAAPATPAARGGKKAAALAPPFLVEIGEIGIESGKVHYDDFAFHPPFQTVFGELTASLKGFSTAPGKSASIEASTNSDKGELLRNTGTVSMEPFVLAGSFSIDGVPLKRYSTFLDEFVPVVIEDGLLDLKTQYRFSTGKDANTVLTGFSAAVKSPRLRKKSEKEPFFKAASLSLSETSIDLAKHEVVLGSLESATGLLAVVREKDGRADLMSLMPQPPPDAPPPPPSPEWSVTLKKLALSGYTVKIDDRGFDRPARYSLTKTDLQLENLSTARDSKGMLTVRAGLDGKGLATAKGPVGFKPIFAELKLDVKGVDLVPLQAYALPNLKLDLARGSARAAGTLSLQEDAGGKASVVYSGDALVSGFFAVDQVTKFDFLKWETLSASGMKAGYNPIFFEARQVTASGVECDITIEADGSVNIRKIVGKPEAPEEEEGVAAPAPEPGAVLPVRIDELTLQGGQIGLADYFIKPNYSATLGNLGGRVTGLSSVDGTVAALDLRGNLANHSPLQISGSVNPLAAASFADIKASFRDIDLAAFTPYSGKYAGYEIASGNLTVEVAYKLQNRKLQASNRFLVTGFDFGQKVESKDATKLPVRLAVSLLKDKDGVIDLDLPIEGSLDDPKFRIGKIIWQILGNLIAKAATAPFALLGKLLGGKGEEYSSVDFADGVARLDDTARKKLDSLAKALENRPALKLQATGCFSGDSDLEGLRRDRLARKVKAQKLVDLVKKGAAPAGVDEVVVEPAEYPEYLKRAYKKEKFPKPRTALGFAKDLPAPEMEKLMLANEAVGDADLRTLALARASAVKDYLTGPGKVDGARVFVLEPADKPAAAKDKARPSRVDFSLK
ncbi:MAG: DUF748 domain-containing protein [Thermoanaerobaculia bacterium]